MKKISKLIQKSNLTAKERIMAMIKNDIHKEKNGESALSDADIQAISGGWSPRDNSEVKEYNKYWNTWDTFVKLGMDMQTIYHLSLLNLAETEKSLVLYYFNDDKSKMGELFMQQSNQETQAKMRQYILDNTGIEYKNLIHRYTFHSLPKSLKEDMISLHPEVEYDASYFEEEEKLASILKGKKELDEQEIEELTQIIIDSIRWNRRDALESKGLSFINTIFYSYFAGYRMSHFAERLADVHEIEYEDDDELHKKIAKIKNLKEELYYVIHDVIAEGLFFDEYIPLCNSEEYSTHSGKTKLKHKTIMSRWLKAKQKITDEIQVYMDNGDLVCEDRDEYVFGVGEEKRIVTGNSLYYADDSLLFVKEYKEQIKILMNYGMLFQIMEIQNIDEKYGNLLRYKEINNKMSEIVGEQATHFADYYLNEIQEKIQQLNLYIYGIRDKMGEDLFMKNKFTFSIEMFFDDFKLDVSHIKPQSRKSLDIFEETAKKYLGNEWK